MQYRDLSITTIADEYIVVACDTSSAIGEKENDMISVPAEIASAYCVRGPLLELLCIGAKPLLVVNLSGNEMKPTGEKYIRGIQQELIKAGYPNLSINGSTEENMLTTMSSIGVTILGRSSQEQLKWKSVMPGDIVFQLGTPYVGEELLRHFDDIISYDDIKKLHQWGNRISEIVPVGSKGSWDEANQLAQMNNQIFRPMKDDVLKAMCEQSAGPSTTVIVAGKLELYQDLCETFKDVFIIGEMEAVNE
ncbi:hypothetical protein [Fundicoccus culcitae]|uniref:Alpha-ribazole-5-phosphate synthase n=1 Tax=Fundicoccus culcitae TaxID=2969821 RepID=A0ABY5P3P1_9LACT|nr:hypothetical protein [Fundicoccus culcitae]UUX33347.1 hypothetical protein NRE15_10605 [Fundicoccus culcitae]